MTELLPNSVVASCGSTNDLARVLAEKGEPGGTWVSARLQNGGRGRLGRKWESRQGNLFLSMIVREVPLNLWSWIPLAASVAIVHALAEEYPRLEARIKWPNDIWVRGAKLGGLLCEGIGSARDSFVIVGAGLNCASAPEGLELPATSLARELGSPVTADQVREKIVSFLRAEVLPLDESSVVFLRREYERLAALPAGTEVSWISGNAAKSGKVVGLGPSGELRVILADGESESLFAEDVKLRPTRKAGGGSPA